MTNQHGEWARKLAELEEQTLRRRLRLVGSTQGPYITIDGRRLCNFAGNNYLGLANHPHVIAMAKAALDEWGWGAGASRLICGHMEPHRQLESRLAAFKRTEAALVCPSGYIANLATIRALAGHGDVVFVDRLSHGSIIDAAFGSGATVRVFGHRDYARLERLLVRTTDAARHIIVTDSIFSMDGDLADLARLVQLRTRYDALLIVDEAHATGVFGEHGAGVAEMQGAEQRIDVVVGTLSKALGGVGGFIAASQAIIDWIINTAGPFIYTTAIPPAACAAAMAALDIIEREPERRQRLLELGDILRRELADRGWNIGESCTQIVPVIVGEPAEALRLSRRIEEAGMLIPAIRPPTVPRGTSRLRISLCAEHTREDLERLVECLGRRAQDPRANSPPCDTNP